MTPPDPSIREPLSEHQIRAALDDLPGWMYDGDRLHASFDLKDFREAVAFIVKLAFEAEVMNHHPEIGNVYNRVSIRLTTHDAGNQVTELDLRLARAIQALTGA